MAKEFRKQAWDEYIKIKQADASKKGTKLVSWGKISIELERIDTTIYKQLPGGELQSIAGNFGTKALGDLAKNIEKITTNEIEIYKVETKNSGKDILAYWIKNPMFKAKRGQGTVDFEGAAARRITDELEKLYTTLGSESIEDVRSRGSAGGFEYEHGNEGTGAASIKYGTEEDASRNVRGLKSQKQVIDAIAKAFKNLNLGDYASAIECAIYDWAECNFNLTTEMKKDRSIKGINDRWQGEGSITLGPTLIPGTSVPKNSRKVDNVIRKEFQNYIQSKKFLKDITSYFAGQPLSKLKKLVSASEGIDAAMVKYGAAALGAVFTKSGTLDKRYKINKKLLAQADKQRNKVRSKGRKSSLETLASRASLQKTSRSGGKRQQTSQSPIALKELINAALPDELLSRMHPPALRNRTGRFRTSVEAVNATIGPKGGVNVDYTYMKMPYQTFEPGFAQGSTNRDPRKLIGQTIREIASEITGNKFITVRRL